MSLLVSIASCPVTGHSWARLAPCSLLTSFWCFYMLMRSSLSLPFSRLDSSSSRSSSLWERRSRPFAISAALCCTLCAMSVSPSWWGAHSWTQSSRGGLSSSAEERGRITCLDLPRPAVSALLTAACPSLSLLRGQGALLTPVQAGVQRDQMVPVSKALLQLGVHRFMGLFLSRCLALSFPLFWGSCLGRAQAQLATESSSTKAHSVQEELSRQHHRQATGSRAGWREGRASSPGGRGGGELEARPGAMEMGTRWPRAPQAGSLSLGAALRSCRPAAGQHALSGGAQQWGRAPGEGSAETNTPALLGRGGIAAPQSQQTDPIGLRAPQPWEEAVGTAVGRGADGSRGGDSSANRVVSNTETFSIAFIVLFLLSNSFRVL